MIGGAKGIGIGIDFGIPNQYCRATSKPYIEKDVLDSLRVVASAYGKSNNDADRSIVKNLVDASNPFIISNTAFKLNSGFGEYEQDFTDWEKSPKVTSFDSESIKFTSDVSWLLLYHPSSIGEDIPSFKVRMKLYGEGTLYYNYITQEGTYTNVAVKSEIFETPICYNTKYTGEKGVNVGFTLGVISGECSGTIEQIPSFEGAFVTDGIDDLITSTKTVSEMGVTNAVTVVSMIHQITGSSISNNHAYTNSLPIDGLNSIPVRNQVIDLGKTGIYGYTYDNGNISVVNNILGDKSDYLAAQSGSYQNTDKFGVLKEGFLTHIAWYWTIIANKVLTTDQINQVIAYFNLDRTLKPDILCNTIKQGITNENHAEFGDKLIDFSGNGRDIQLNNIAWKGDSGIGKYEVDFLDSSIWNSSNSTITSSKIDCKNAISHIMLLYYSVGSKEYPDIPSFKVIKTGADIDYSYIDETGFPKSVKIVDGENVLPASHNTLHSGSDRFCGFGNPGMGNSVIITQIPSHAGALCLDGVNDFGKVTGMPVYKDYTVVTDREIFANIGAILSKNNPGAFVETAGNSVYSFGQATSGLKFISTRSISYLSKYSYCGQSIAAGAAEDVPDMWLGTIRDGDSRFFNGAIYSLMSFPYSMSEFLIERQLKKHKLGTLYPDMVEFRPVIKSSVELVNKPSFAIRGTSTLLNAGDYIPENSEIWVVIAMNNAADRITKFVINGNTIDIPSSAYNPSTMKYGFPFTIDSKSPQKITMTIEQDENYVQWNPVVTSNVEYTRLDFYLNNYVQLIKIGDYIPKDAYLRANLYLKNNVDELTVLTFNGVNIDYKRSVVDDTAFNIGAIYNYDSPQEVNITIDEYIRYEDIDFTNCYPGVPRIYVNDKSVTWGDKLKVGDEFTFYGNVNILPEMYNVLVKALYNGEEMVYGSIGTISKSMAFTAFKTYTFDDNEPKCILSPRLLNIPNSSYKILGYIPDISGHGNNGKINNSAYAEMSGANGYPYDYKSTSDFVAHASNAVLVNSEIVKFVNVLTQTSFYYKGTSYKGKIKVTGITKAIASGKVRYLDIYSNSTTNDERIIIDKDGTYDVNIETEDAVNIFFYLTPIVSGTTALDEPVYLEQVGNYEGAYCLDGVNDFVTIPTVNGGKQVFMKVNVMTTIDKILYDQRNSKEGGNFSDHFAIMTSNSDSILAYAGRNPDGKTYIDGILNTNITCGQLLNITHNITALVGDNKPLGKGGVIIGASKKPASYCKAAVYDFMLFDEISTDDKIQELNEYVGIEAKVELPPYYWDAYGKTNSDADKDTIQQRGIAVGDYDLINYNHAYEGMSGYNGYPIILSGTNRTYQDKASYVNVVGDDKNVINLTRISFNTAGIFSYVKQNGVLTSYNKDIESFKIKVTGIDFSRFIIKYSYISEANATAKTTMTIASDSIYELPKSFASDGSLTSSDVWIGINFTKQSTDIPDIIEDVNVTIEVLPEYENGLVYDGVEDFSDNKNVPIIDDFTVIAKRTWLEENISDKPFIIKGDTLYPDGNQNAFLFEYGKLSTYSFGQNNKYDESVVPSLISWATPTSYNGTTSLVRGSAIDTVGIDIAHATKMVLYKLILYPKTISLLEINFLKNLMEKDEIIDLNNPIFIQ